MLIQAMFTKINNKYAKFINGENSDCQLLVDIFNRYIKKVNVGEDIHPYVNELKTKKQLFNNCNRKG